MWPRLKIKPFLSCYSTRIKVQTGFKCNLRSRLTRHSSPRISLSLFSTSYHFFSHVSPLPFIPFKFSCHPSLHLSLSLPCSLAHFKVSRCVILARRGAAADESDAAAELLIDLLHHMHTTSPIKIHSHTQVDRPKRAWKCPPLIYIVKTQTSLKSIPFFSSISTP